jgi:probable phosphoglycerate mutase
VELVLIRHGEPARPHEDTDRRDPGLSRLGETQVARLARFLRDDADGAPFVALYVSPLRRALQTAAVLAEVLALKARVLDGLAEFDRNATEYLNFDDLRAARDPRYEACVVGGDLTPWGTDLQTFREQFTGAVDTIAAAHPEGRVLAVTHGGVINGFVGGLLGSTAFFFHRPEYSGFSRVLVDGPVRRVVSVNEHAHLTVGAYAPLPVVSA